MDGAQNWFAETLLDELNNAYDEGTNENDLDKEVYADDKGIWECEEGYRGRLMYSIINGKWNDEGEFEQE